MSMCVIIDDVDLDHLVTVVPARSLHWKVTIFPFVIHKYLGGDSMR